MISRGGGPRTPCDVTCGDKQMGEVKRVLARRHKSAEPIEAERAGTSDPVSGSACKPAMVKETESMADASLEYGTCQLGSGQDGSRPGLGNGGVLACSGDSQAGGTQLSARQPWDVFTVFHGLIPHGVKSAPKAGKRSHSEPKNLNTASLSLSLAGMMEATHDRCGEGRSLRSSLRAGKPSTRPARPRQREAVDTVSEQEAGLCPTR